VTKQSLCAIHPLSVPVPPQVPIVKFFSPNKADQGLIEFWNTSVSSYVPLDQGAPHPDTRDRAGFKLGKQFNLPNDEKFVVRVWVTDETSPTWWDWSEKFLAESASHPIFIRQSREPRNTYAPKTKSQPLKSVYKLSLTNAGTGYTPDTQPALAFSGGAGSGAAGHAVVNKDGTIAELVLDSGGDNYTSAPTFTVAASPSGGTTATGTAYIQPTTAVLVAEEAQPFPADSEFFGLYLQVVRVYQTLPGPVLSEKEYDQEWDVVIPRTRQRVLNSAVNLATNRQDVKALDSVQSELVTFDPTALAAVFDTYLNYMSSTTNLQLPDVLTSLTGVESSAVGNGTYAEAATGSGNGTTFFLSMSTQGTAQGSASKMLDVLVEIKQYWARNIPVVTYYFFLQSPVTAAAVLAKLQTLSGLTITAWPKFVPQAHTVICKGQKFSGEARAKTAFQQSSSSDGSSATDTGGKGYGLDVSTSIRGIRIPPTIHDTINIGGTTSDAGTDVLAITATASDPINGAISVPLTGVKLLRSEPVKRWFGYVMVACDTVDMANVA
jgi:hypothetical protein